MKNKALIIIIALFIIVLILIIIFRPKPTQQAAEPDKLGYVHPVLIKTNKWKELTSVNIQRYRGNDTFLITQNTNSWLLNQDSGLSWDQPLVFINATGKRIIVKGGIQSENCQYIKILGWGSTDAYGFEFRGGGVAGNFSGMYVGLSIQSCRFTGGSQGPLWIKEEAPHACDFYNYWKNQSKDDYEKYGIIDRYLAPYYQDSVWVEHCWIDSSGGDAYFGSTGTIKGRDVVPCKNNSKPPTMQTRNFHLNYNYVNYLGRSGLQLSLAVAGTNEIIGNLITNCGYEWPETHGDAAKSQGAGIRVGSGCVNVEVAKNIVKYTNLYNYDLGEANVNFHDNAGDSVGYVVYHGSPYFGEQALPSFIVHADNPQRGTLKMANNKMLHTGASDNIAFAIYGGNNFTMVNDTCSNTGGNATVLSKPFIATNVNCIDTAEETTDTTVSIIHDTPSLITLPPVLGKVYDSTEADTTAIKDVKLHGEPAKKTISKVNNWAMYDEILPERDSVITIKTPAHDTTIRIPKK